MANLNIRFFSYFFWHKTHDLEAAQITIEKLIKY